METTMLDEEPVAVTELQSDGVTILVGEDWNDLKEYLHTVYIRPTHDVPPGRRGAIYYMGYSGDLPKAVTVIGKYVEESGWMFETDNEYLNVNNYAVMVADDLLEAWEHSFT
jgi:hypothetical protein